LDFKVQEEVLNNDGAFDRIILAAVPEKQADEYMKIPQLLNKEMEAIDLPANSISKFLSAIGLGKTEEEGGPVSKEFAVLDIGYETTGVYIFYEDKLRFNRILLNGSGDIDKLISNNFNVDSKQAEEIKILNTRIFSEEEETGEASDQIQLCNVIRPAVNSVIMDINRFFDFYNSRSTENKLQMIYICGGGSKLEGIDGYISGYFNIPVRHISAAGNITYLGIKKHEEFQNDFAYLVNAIGAVVRHN
jgi:type IV pilus assembly protein PilM